MINIVMWLSDNKYKDELSVACARSNIRIVADEFENHEDFLKEFDVMDTNIDVLAISNDRLAGTDIKRFLEEVRLTEPNIRIVVIFPGYRNQYIEEQIAEYKRLGISDIIYEGQRLDEECFVEVIRKGYIYDYSVNVFDDEPEYTGSHTNDKSECVTIGIMGITHGTGVTNMAVSIANYISLAENKHVKVIDYSGTGSLRFASGRKVTYIVNTDADIQKLKRYSRAVIYDFGTPYNISAKGKLLSENRCYADARIKLFWECDLKLIMGFSDIWHIGKIKFFLNNKAWKKKIDSTYLFLFDNADDDFKSKHKKLNIYGRNEKAVQKHISHLLLR